MPLTLEAIDPRAIAADKVDRMRERCGLVADYHNLVLASDRGDRRTGRTTLMLLRVLVLYEEGHSVVIVGQTTLLRPRFQDMLAAAHVPPQTPAAGFIDYPWRNVSHHHIHPATAVFVDHWAAHQMVEESVGAVVMESPN